MAAAATDTPRTRFYMLESFKLKNGTELPRLHEHFSKTLLPAADRIWGGPKIFLEALVAPHMPQLLVVYGFRSLDEMWGVQGKMMEDEKLAKTFQALDSGPEPPFETLDTTLLETTPYSPEIPAGPAKTSRIFELRTYHSPTYTQLMALHERFSGPEIKIFHSVGIHPLFYTSTVIGQNIPNLTYLIPFENLAEREKAWNAFGADPEWVKVRKESIDKHGQISSVIQISLFKATEYSPVR